MDKFKIDSHKLTLHPARTAEWLEKGDVYPLYMEASPSGACNHRCVFCGLDFMGYKPRFLDPPLMRDRFMEMAGLGLKSVMFAGEGEPLLHKEFATLVRDAAEAGLDTALTSNGVLLAGPVLDLLLERTSWIKISCNAGRAETYSRIHNCSQNDFNRVFKNLDRAVKLRQERGVDCALGAQSLLLPENRGEMAELALRCRDAGLDYLVVKPYSQHPQSETRLFQDVSYERDLALAEEFAAISDENFSVVFRTKAMRRWNDQNKGYDRCLALPFWSYLDAAGNIWGCSMFLNDERFRYGNLYQSTFEEIWRGEKRRQSLRMVAEELDARGCRVNCRMDAVNRYLWELKNPGPHVNFI